MIYFIQDYTLNLIKIGFTSGEAENRLNALQTGSPAGLSLLITIPGTQEDERDLHKRFEMLRDRGEWFRPGPSLLSYLLQSVLVLGRHQGADAVEKSPDTKFMVLDEICDSWHPTQVGRSMQLVCPACGFECVHIGENKSSMADSWHGYGRRRIIRINGECGHSWDLSIGFHKGNTIVFASEVETVNAVCGRNE